MPHVCAKGSVEFEKCTILAPRKNLTISFCLIEDSLILCYPAVILYYKTSLFKQVLHVEVRKNSKSLHLQCFTAQSRLPFSFSLSASYWGSSVFLIPSQCGLSAPSHSSSRKSGWDDGGLGKRRDRERVCVCWHLLPVLLCSSPSLCFTKSPLYLSASNVPTDSFVVNELSSAMWNFLNPHTQAHTGTLSLQIFILGLSPLIFFLHNPVPISVSKTTTSSVSWGFAIKGFADGTKLFFCLSCMRYWRWRESYDCKLSSNALSPNRASSNSLSPLRDRKGDFSPFYVYV